MGRITSLALLMAALLGNGLTAQAASVLQVYEGTTPLPGAVGLQETSAPVAYDAAPVGRSRSKTFTVKNVGSTAVQLNDAIEVPKGFTLMRRFGKTTLEAGQATTFTVALNARKAGNYTGRVVLRSNATKETLAFPINGAAEAPPSLRILDDAGAGFRTVGEWARQTGKGFGGDVHFIAPGQGAAVATWTFNGLVPGQYKVAVTYPQGNDRASAARFTVVAGRETNAAVSINQQAAPADFHDAGRDWRNVGTYRLMGSDTLSVRLSDEADGFVVADAVRIERLNYGGGIVDNSDAGFRAEGGWLHALSQGFQGDQAQKAPTAGATATWTFAGLTPGEYRVAVTWAAAANRARNASFTVLDGANAVGQATVDQRLAPRQFVDGGVRWQDLGRSGEVYSIGGDTLAVRLTAEGADGPVVADAVRIERVNGPTVSSLYDDVRFLEQTTWGPNDEWVNYLQSIGQEAFLIEQMSLGLPGYPNFPTVPQNANNYCAMGTAGNDCRRDHYSMHRLQTRFFNSAIYGGDQFRQRMAWALHQIWVVGGTDADTNKVYRMKPYLEILDWYSFGNFRDLMGAVTLNAVMGAYLDMNGSTATRPNENYARELLQLFTIGLDVLNPDGTPVLVGGQRVPTYTQDHVDAFTRALTGWGLAAPPGQGLLNYTDPMVVAQNGGLHDFATPRPLLLNGFRLPGGRSGAAGVRSDLNDALNNIFNHANVGPFISKNLIQHLVTSNPSPDYVARVASVFANNGAGVRGDLSAVAYAIIVDPEARGDVAYDPNYGKLREPAQYANNILRAFYAVSRNDPGQASDGYINPQSVNMGQDVYRPPSVFNYFTPDYEPTAARPGLLGPEFQILVTATTLRRANFINTMTFGNGIAINGTTAPYGTSLDLAILRYYADNPATMVDYLDYLLMHGTMSAQMKSRIITAISAVPANNPHRRAQFAVYLVATSSQYQVQR